MSDLSKSDLEILDANITNISLSAKMSIDYNSIDFSISMDVHPDVGYDKTYKFMRGQIYYRMQQLKKDIHNKLKYTDGGDLPQHRN